MQQNHITFSVTQYSDSVFLYISKCMISTVITVMIHRGYIIIDCFPHCTSYICDSLQFCNWKLIPCNLPHLFLSFSYPILSGSLSITLVSVLLIYFLDFTPCLFCLTVITLVSFSFLWFIQENWFFFFFQVERPHFRFKNVFFRCPYLPHFL